MAALHDGPDRHGEQLAAVAALAHARLGALALQGVDAPAGGLVLHPGQHPPDGVRGKGHQAPTPKGFRCFL